MDIYKAAILGIVQGLTEFLPVSSSGHLVLGKALLGIGKIDLAFEVFVHFGTLLAVILIFWHDILKIVKSFLLLFRASTYQVGLLSTYRSNSSFRWIWYILLATIPASVIGLLFEQSIESAFSNPHLVALMLLVTGAILLTTFFCKSTGAPIRLSQAIAVGFAQAFAILPGISRSGSTISTALVLNVERDEAARFSFILVIPAIAGATLLKTIELLTLPMNGQLLLSLTVATVTSFISGYIAIRFLLGIVRRGKLYWFAMYCFTIGIIGLLTV